MAKTKSGRDLKPERIYKGPPIARRFFGFFGIGPGLDDSDDE